MQTRPFTQVIARLALLGLLAACAATGRDPAPSTEAPSERAANEATFAAEGERLAALYSGHWILIDNGNATTLGPDPATAWTEAVRLAANASHAFLYRAGIDESDVEFVLSPFTMDQPRWTQIGRSVLAPFGITMHFAEDAWSRPLDGTIASVKWGPGGARLEFDSPAGERSSASPAVASALFDGELTLPESVLASMGAGPFEAPGVARYAGRSEPCRKVPLVVRIDELGIRAHVVAYVLPPSVTGENDVPAPN